MRITASLVIGLLCLAVAGLTLSMAAPSKRLIAIILVVTPFLLAAGFAFRKHRQHLRLLALRSAAPRTEQPLSALISDPASFIARTPQLAAAFRSWAAERDSGPLDTLAQLENFAAVHGGAIPREGSLFEGWVAAYGESLRAVTDGHWSIGRVLAPHEPIVIAGRFPFLRHRILLPAIQVLDAAEDLEWQ